MSIRFKKIKIINLVPKNHKGKIVRISWASLDQELVSPAVERLEGVGRGHVVGEHTTVGAAIESHPKRLEPLLEREYDIMSIWWDVVTK